ncbi:MAG: hypothetical protein RIT05_1112, partial [Bacteroidota bacterium]
MKELIQQTALRTLDLEAQSILGLRSSINDQFIKAVEALST